MTLLRHRDRIEGDLVIEVAFTDSSLDLGDHAPDDVRRRGLAVVAEETGATPVLMRQVHGATVVLVEDRDPSTPPEADALVTVRQGVALLSRAADCVPVLLGDPDAGVVGAVHAGRKGVTSGVVGHAVERLRSLGGDELHAWIGPSVCGACYEVPTELQEEVAAVVPETRSTTSWRTPSLDLQAGVRAQLAAAGVDDVRTVGACTREDPSWPSFRRDGAAATRFAGVVWSHARG